ncbi:MAG: nuclear transport factor 2 family protein [Sphingobium sp.]|nr:nuclear transport factor 2 family protein [Sphingobium sp.]
MDRRQFVGLAAAIAAVPAGLRAASGEENAVRQRVKDVYKAFSTGDIARYRASMTGDYLFIADGDLTDLEGDIKEFGARPKDFRRTDVIDFKHVHVGGDVAYAVYYISAHETGTGFEPRDPRWLETMILRKTGSEWRCALIHSSRLDTFIVTPVRDGA